MLGLLVVLAVNRDEMSVAFFDAVVTLPPFAFRVPDFVFIEGRDAHDPAPDAGHFRAALEQHDATEKLQEDFGDDVMRVRQGYGCPGKSRLRRDCFWTACSEPSRVPW